VKQKISLDSIQPLSVSMNIASILAQWNGFESIYESSGLILYGVTCFSLS